MKFHAQLEWHSGLQLRVRYNNFILLILNQTYVVGTQKNSLNEHPKHIYVNTCGLEKIYNFMLKMFVYLNLWLTLLK